MLRHRRVDPWCSGPTCQPVTLEIAGSNPVGSATFLACSYAPSARPDGAFLLSVGCPGNEQERAARPCPDVGHAAHDGSMTRLSRILLVVSTVALVGGCAASATAPRDGSPVQGPALEVSADEAARLRDEGALVLDVREPAEWAAGHVPGAMLIPLGEIASRTGEVPHDRTIVVICRSGNRSAQGRDILMDAGFSPVTSVRGGITAWTAAGLPIETGS
jgi:rhodanese-related sulfurtransferase